MIASHQLPHISHSPFDGCRNTYAIILFWDTDVSDVDESTMTTSQVARLREAYREVSERDQRLIYLI